MVSIFQRKILLPKKSSIPEGSSSKLGWCILVLRLGLHFPCFKCHITLSDTLVEPCRDFNERIIWFHEFLAKILIFTGFWMTEYHPILQTCQHLPIATLLFLAPTKLFVPPTLTLRCQPLCVKRKFPRSLLLEIWNFFPSIRRCQPWRQLFLKELKK